MNKYSKILCFDGKTAVKTQDGSSLIKDIVPGTEIVSYDCLNNALCVDKVIATAKSLHKLCAVLLFEDGTSIKCTADHPLFVKDKGWCAANSNNIDEMYGVKVTQLKEGDVCSLLIENEMSSIRLVSINRMECSEFFYCISTEKYNNFFANSILAHDICVDKFSQAFMLREGIIVNR